MMRYLIVLLAAAVLFPSMAAADDAAAWRFESESANAAIKSFERAKSGLDRSNAEAQTQVRLALIVSLKEALNRAREAGHQEEAAKLGRAIHALQIKNKTTGNSLLPDGIYLAAEFDSIWTHEYHIDGDNIQLVRVIHDNGAKHDVGWTGKVNTIGPTTVEILWTLPNGKKSRDVWGIADARIFVQHWPIGSPADKPAPHHLITDVKR